MGQTVSKLETYLCEERGVAVLHQQQLLHLLLVLVHLLASTVDLGDKAALLIRVVVGRIGARGVVRRARAGLEARENVELGVQLKLRLECLRK